MLNQCEVFVKFWESYIIVLPSVNMKKKLLSLIIFLLTTAVYCQEKSESPFVDDHIFSIDFSGVLKNIGNKGFGLGLSYEKIFFDCWSVKGNFSHLQFWTNDEKVKVVTAESVSLGTFFYPFFKKLNYLYFGGGCSTDFVQFSSTENNTVTYLYPQIGWKQNIKDYVLLDVFFRYDIPVSSGSYSDYEKIIRNQRTGFGFAVKFNLKKIFGFR